MENESYRIELGGETRYGTIANWEAIADELHAKHGGVPNITRVANGTAPTEPAPPSAAAVAPRRGLSMSTPRPAPVAPAVPPSVPRGVGHIDAAGRDRSARDLEAAKAAGFAPAAPLYDRGTRVIDIGVENARAARLEWERMPTTVDGCTDLVGQIATEGRRDVTIDTASLHMADNGLIRYADGREVALTEVGFKGLLSRTGINGWHYLTRCRPALRAYNINDWTAQRRASEAARAGEAAAAGKRAPEAHELVLRERNMRDKAGVQHEEIFGVVTPSYARYDVDMVAEAIRRAAPPEARGRVTYDGCRARFEVLLHTTVQPEQFVAGEFFRAGVVIDTDDTGGGSVRGSAMVWQNLCLNLIVIDAAAGSTFNLRHIGSVEALAKSLEENFATCLASIDHFRAQWGYAAGEDILARARANDAEVPLTIEDAIPGFFRAILMNELVKVPEKVEVAVPKLVSSWARDTSAARGGTRAAIVNAFTRYAHEEIEVDPWEEDAIQRAAGRLLYGPRANARPAPLPYTSLIED